MRRAVTEPPGGQLLGAGWRGNRGGSAARADSMRATITRVVGERVCVQEGGFTVPYLVTGTLALYVNGLRMCEGADYEVDAGGCVRALAGTRLALVLAEDPDVIVLCDYWRF